MLKQEQQQEMMNMYNLLEKKQRGKQRKHPGKEMNSNYLSLKMTFMREKTTELENGDEDNENVALC